MKVKLPRRPLFAATLAFIGGIAFVYIFSPTTWLMATLLTISVIAGIVMHNCGLRVCARNDKHKHVIPALTSVMPVSKSVIPAPASVIPAPEPVSIKPRLVFPLLLAAIFFASSLYTIHSFGETDPLMTAAESSDTVAISGRVVKIQIKDSDYYVLTVQSEGRKILVRIFADIAADPKTAPKAIMGRNITFKAKVMLPDTARNPRCFDYRLHLLSQDIRVIATAEAGSLSLVSTSGKADGVVGNLIGSFYNHLYNVKCEFYDIIAESMSGENAAVMNGMLFGDTSLIDEDTYEGFQKNGIAHILSVSGLHVAMVYAFISKLFSNRRTRSTYAVIIIFLIIYAALAEFSPPAVRAVIMISVHLTSKIVFKRYDFLTSISLSALLILLHNPLELFGVGFQLSFLAVASLAFALPFSDKFIGYRWRVTQNKLNEKEIETYMNNTVFTRLGRGLSKLFLPILIIQLFMMPITAYAFNYTSLSAFVLNVPIVFLAGFIVPLGIVLLIFAELFLLYPPAEALLSIFAKVLSEISEMLVATMNYLSDLGTAAHFSSFIVASPKAPFMLIFYGLAFFLLSESFTVLKSRKLYRQISVITAIIFTLSLATFASPTTSQNNAALTFVDVGQGDCLHIKTADGKNYLLDGGGSADYNIGKKTLLPYLLKNGVRRLDGVFVSHLHMDHFKGVTELAEKMDIGAIYTYAGNVVRKEELTNKVWNSEKEYQGGPPRQAEPATPPKEGNSGFGKFPSEEGWQTKSDGVVSSKDLRFVGAGDTVNLGKNAKAEILFPPRGTPDDYKRTVLENEDENATSLLVRISVGKLSVLMTGDLGFDGEARILALAEDESKLQTDILKIGHHGSKTSTSDEFLKAVMPSVSVIQVGKNNYGHPTPEVLDKLRDAGIITYRNDTCGAIMMDEKPAQRIAVKTEQTSFTSKALLGKYRR
ncbi:MAG: DNA internalization-related competence protein ComEC/Rec2 [Clostridiales Family XIII bacterium]|jgi:competence protein ComEC|nr:DNA internalization-related competence protein ComEC/Rec2 [Clostridiales Family XIII bacterium]